MDSLIISFLVHITDFVLIFSVAFQVFLENNFPVLAFKNF